MSPSSVRPPPPTAPAGAATGHHRQAAREADAEGPPEAEARREQGDTHDGRDGGRVRHAGRGEARPHPDGGAGAGPGQEDEEAQAFQEAADADEPLEPGGAVFEL